MIDTWRDLANIIAERAVAVGPHPMARRLQTVNSTAGAVPAGPIVDRDVVRQLTDSLADLSTRARHRMDQLTDQDSVTQTILTGVAEAEEQQLGMARVPVFKGAT